MMKLKTSAWGKIDVVIETLVLPMIMLRVILTHLVELRLSLMVSLVLGAPVLKIKLLEVRARSRSWMAMHTNPLVLILVPPAWVAMYPSISSICKGGPGKPCGEPVRHSECGVACDKCEHWFHASCQGILKPAFEALSKYKVSAWLCPDCKQSLKGHSTSPKGHNNLTLETKVEQLATLVDTHMHQVEQSLKEQEHAVHEQTKLIERSIRDGHT